MSMSWFDPKTGVLLLDEYVADRPSFKKIMEDGTVTIVELAAQADLVVSLLKKLEASLPSETKALATNAFIELVVLHAIQTRHSGQHL